MKFTVTLIALSAVAVQAASVTHPTNPKAGQEKPAVVFDKGLGYCNLPGGKCAHARRAAEAVFNAISDNEKIAAGKRTSSLSNWCAAAGGPCYDAHDHVLNLESVADKVHSAVQRREPEPEAKIGFCGARGTTCQKARSAEAEASRVGYHVGFCGARGTTCQKRRNAEPEPEAKIGFCGARGTTCQRRREAEAEASRVGYHVGFCGARGTTCQKRSAEPSRAGYHVGFCGARGTTCQKRRAAEEKAATGESTSFWDIPGANDDEAKARNVTDAIKSFDPALLRDQCYEEGGECTGILNAYKAYNQVKRDIEAEQKIPTSELHVRCRDVSCGVFPEEHLLAAVEGHPAAAKAEKECNGPDGHCTLAARDLQELEDAVNKAMNSLDNDDAQ